MSGGERPWVLFVEAHPDDMELGMGGTAAVLARSHRLHIISLTQSERSLPGCGDAEARRVRADEARAAAAVLGASLELHDVPDAGSDQARDRVAAVVANAVSALRPAFVCTHWPEDFHVDHKACAEAVLDRASNAVLWEGSSSLCFRPNVHVDVTPVIGAKRRLLDSFPSQHYMQAFPQAFEALARRGKAIGSWFAEALAVPDAQTRAALLEALAGLGRETEG